MRPTLAIIHLENLRHNIRIVKKLASPGQKICAAVKADAYGHGAIPIAKTLLQEEVTHLGVATIEEGLELRQAGITASILLFCLPAPEELEILVKAELTPFVADTTLINLLAREASRQKKKLKVHLKVDTGMGRIGCRPTEALSLARLIAEQTSLELEGLATHFPVSDQTDSTLTYEQIRLMKTLRKNIEQSGIKISLMHAANSGAIIGYPDAFFDMLRPGIMLYGYYPSKNQPRRLELKPVMEFKTKIVFIKEVAAGTSISYGLTYKTTTSTRIATLPVGYADGYSRLLSNLAEVYIHGRRFPVAGRICMDQTMVDLKNARDIQCYDEVVLFGAKGAPDAEEIAGLMGTIPYEVTSLISKRVPRIYTD